MLSGSHGLIDASSNCGRGAGACASMPGVQTTRAKMATAARAAHLVRIGSLHSIDDDEVARRARRLEAQARAAVRGR